MSNRNLARAVDPDGPQTTFETSEGALVLCSRCSRINFSHLSARRSRAPMKLASLRTSDLCLGSCSLCSLFDTIWPETEDPNQEVVLAAITEDARENSPWRVDLPETSALLALCPVPDRGDWFVHQDGEFIYAEKCSNPINEIAESHTGVPDLACDIVEWPLLQGWLQECTEDHDSCEQLQAPQTIAYFNVIDCQDRRLVAAPQDCQYMALSYVWGTDPFAESDLELGQSLPMSQPKTIEDSILVARGLNVPYLWIDRYCIPQGNNQIKSGLIGQMDKVYANAYATIIAAAGSSPRHGLPGVSSPRARQSKLITLGYRFVSAKKEPRLAVKLSPWIGRAWTYQEAIFSRRRIFFNEEQVYFECGKMCSTETPIARGIADAELPPYMLLNSSERLFTHGTPGRCRHVDIAGRIREYNQRELSYPGDILNGAEGFLRAEDVDGPGHLWGVPILYVGKRGNKYNPTRSHKDGFVSGLQCFTLEPSHRRTDFPSWSWTGWYGKSLDEEYRDILFGVHSESRTSEDVNIWIETADRAKMEWSKFQQATPANSSVYSIFLHIEAFTMSVTIQYYDKFSISSCGNYSAHMEGKDRRTYDITGHFANLMVTADYTQYSTVRIHDADIEKRSRNAAVTVTAVLLEDIQYLEQGGEVGLLLVTNHGPHHECVGTTSIGGGRKENTWDCHHELGVECNRDQARTVFSAKEWKLLESQFVRRDLRLG